MPYRTCTSFFPASVSPFMLLVFLVLNNFPRQPEGSFRSPWYFKPAKASVYTVFWLVRPFMPSGPWFSTKKQTGTLANTTDKVAVPILIVMCVCEFVGVCVCESVRV